MRVALVSCLELPEPDFDEAPLSAGLREVGIEVESPAWDDPRVDWARFDACLLRATWNYHLHPQRFVAWLERVAGQTRLWNPLEVVRWNVHKGYLLELEGNGIPVAPTALLPAGQPPSLGAVLAERGWSEAVIKPAISAGSRDTLWVTSSAPSSLEAGEAHLASLLAREDVLVQEYLASVEEYGERSLVWIDGAFTHAVLKRPRFRDDEESVEGPMPIAGDELEIAERAIDHLEQELLYARVDLARDRAGQPRLMELELIEPSLFFAQGPEALRRYVAAVERLSA